MDPIGRGVVCLLSVALGWAAGAGPGAAQAAELSGGAEGGASTRPAVLATRPAVQSVRVEQQGSLEVTGARVDARAWRKLTAKLSAKQRAHRLPTGARALDRARLAAIARDVGTYLEPNGTPRTVAASMTTTCAAWFATPTGHLVTARGCVRPGASDLAAALRDQRLPGLVADHLPATSRMLTTTEPDDGMREALRRITSTWLAAHTDLVSSTPRVAVDLGVEGADGDRGARELSARLLSAKGAVAVLAVVGYQHLPSLSVADDVPPTGATSLYLAGNQDSGASSRAARDAPRDPTFSRATVTGADGAGYLRTTSAYHGAPGAPVLDRDGQVVGVVVRNGDGRQVAAPGRVVSEQLAAVGVRATADPVTSRYAQALADYDDEYYDRALDGFLAVQLDFPQHPYVARYVDSAREQIDAGNDRTPVTAAEEPSWTSPTRLAGVILGAAVLLVALLCARRLRRPRGRHRTPVA